MIQLYMKSTKDSVPHAFLYFLAWKLNFHHGHGYESHDLAMINLREMTRSYIPELYCQNFMIINTQISLEYNVD